MNSGVDISVSHIRWWGIVNSETLAEINAKIVVEMIQDA
jgi:hypothetical protein